MYPIQSHHLTVQKTARYYSFGKLNPQTRHLWYVCHGYGQLASSILSKFTILDPDLHYVIAPEGLSRFYWNGFGGKPVAAWMTSEDRDAEIDDYVRYLDQLHRQTLSLLEQTVSRGVSVTVLGFSQGVATISRWLTMGNIRADRTIFWAGNLAYDLDKTRAANIFNNTHLLAVIGKQDPFLDQDAVQKQTAWFDAHGIQHPEMIWFDGEHELNKSVIEQLAQMP